jgi:iron complex transport system ATP-binding protein
LALYHYSVLDFILMGRTPHLGLFGLPGANDTRISEEVMKHLGLADLAQRSYLSLSAGERQMVLLARALVQEAPVIVMDEPTTYLDYQKQYSFMHTLKELVKARGLAALVSLHDPNLAIRFADKMIFIKNNKFLSEVDFHSGDQMVKLKRAFHAMYGGQVAIRNSEDETIACWTQKDWGE